MDVNQELIKKGLNQERQVAFSVAGDKHFFFRKGVQKVMDAMGVGYYSENLAVKRLVDSGLFEKPEEAKQCLDYLVQKSIEVDSAKNPRPSSFWDIITGRSQKIRGVVKVATVDGSQGYRFYQYKYACLVYSF